MKLSRYTLKNINPGKVTLPDEALFELPEKVLQFGTDVLLRGLPDYFIDKANRQGLFNGRIVVVKSTAQGDSSVFDKQDGLYTFCIRDLQNGEKVVVNNINSAISRVLDADTEWKQVLECAHNQSIQIIVSNTTEVGIKLVPEDILRHPPASFPGKLLAFLYERFRAFGGSDRSGLVIIPTELIPGNATKLEAIVLELAHLNGLEDEFIAWLENHNHFCNSLVDRIVPGKPDAATQTAIFEELGYTDQFLVMAEAYRLWAIEGNDEVKNCLSFAQVDNGVFITPSIDSNRELKLRLLNGSHTLSCGLAFLVGCDTVKEAMDNEGFSSFIANLMLQEITPSIPYPVDPTAAQAFGHKVLERFRNPYLQHQWIDISMQYSAKMKIHCIPVLLRHFSEQDTVPELIALGFAAYLYFMKAVKQVGNKFYGERSGEEYPIIDDQAEVYFKRWESLSTDALVKETLRDRAFWGTELNILPEFEQAVTDKLNYIVQHGPREAINAVYSTKEVVA